MFGEELTGNLTGVRSYKARKERGLRKDVETGYLELNFGYGSGKKTLKVEIPNPEQRREIARILRYAVRNANVRLGTDSGRPKNRDMLFKLTSRDGSKTAYLKLTSRDGNATLRGYFAKTRERYLEGISIAKQIRSELSPLTYAATEAKNSKEKAV